MNDQKCKTCGGTGKVPCPFYSEGVDARDCVKGQELDCPEEYQDGCFRPCPSCSLCKTCGGKGKVRCPDFEPWPEGTCQHWRTRECRPYHDDRIVDESSDAAMDAACFIVCPTCSGGDDRRADVRQDCRTTDSSCARCEGGRVECEHHGDVECDRHTIEKPCPDGARDDCTVPCPECSPCKTCGGTGRIQKRPTSSACR